MMDSVDLISAILLVTALGMPLIQWTSACVLMFPLQGVLPNHVHRVLEFLTQVKNTCSEYSFSYILTSFDLFLLSFLSSSKYFPISIAVLSLTQGLFRRALFCISFKPMVYPLQMCFRGEALQTL